MRLIFSILTAIVVIAAAVVFVGPMFISADDVRNQIFAQVESTTGYRIRVSGPVDITLFPSLDLVAEDVGIAQPASGSDAEFATAKTLKFGLMLRGLLDGKMRVTDLTLVDPVIAVPKTQAKAAPAAQTGRRRRVAPTVACRAAAATSVADKLKNLTLDKLVIKNGTVILPPSGDTPGKRIEKLNLEAALPAYDQPLSFDVAAVVDGKAMQANGSISNFGQFLEGAPARVALTVDAPDTLDAKASMSGTATYKNDILTLSQFSAKSGDKTLSGTAVYQDGTVTLSPFTATAGRDTFAGKAIYKDNIVTVSPLRANVRGTLLSGSVTSQSRQQGSLCRGGAGGEDARRQCADGHAEVEAVAAAAAVAVAASGGGGSWRQWRRCSSLERRQDRFLAAEAPQRQVQRLRRAADLRPDQDQSGDGPGDAQRRQAQRHAVEVQSLWRRRQCRDRGRRERQDAGAAGPAHACQVRRRPLLMDAADFQRIEGRGTVSLDLNA